MADPAPGVAAPPPPPPASPAAAPAPSPMSSMLATMGTAELMAVGGALLVLITDVVFGVFGPYSVGSVNWTAAGFVVVAALIVRFMHMTLPLAYETILIVAGFIAAINGVRDLVYDVLNVTSPGNTPITYILGMVLLYVGLALMFVGAWMLWRGRRA